MKKRFLTGLTVGFLVFCMAGIAQALTIEFNAVQWAGGPVSQGSFIGEDDDSDGILSLGELTAFSFFETTLGDLTLFGTFTIGNTIVGNTINGNTWEDDKIFSPFGTDYPVYYATSPSGRMLSSFWWNVWITEVTIDQGSSPVPEPATMLLFGLGLLGLAGVNRRKK